MQSASDHDSGPSALKDASHCGGATGEVPAERQAGDQTSAAGLHDGSLVAALQVSGPFHFG